MKMVGITGVISSELVLALAATEKQSRIIVVRRIFKFISRRYYRYELARKADIN